MDPSAKKTWIEWYEKHQEQVASISENLRGIWAKMPSQAARLILICHLMRWSCNQKESLNRIERRDVEVGVRLAEYFKSHGEHVRGIIHEDPVGRITRKIVTWIARHGNTGIRPRELAQAGIAGADRAGEARKHLDRMATEGVGEWRAGARGLSGRHREPRFFLRQS